MSDKPTTERYEREAMLEAARALAAALKENDQLREQLAAAVEALKWLDEFVIEPEYFPGEGDRQWWQEKRDSIHKM